MYFRKETFKIGIRQRLLQGANFFQKCKAFNTKVID